LADPDGRFSLDLPLAEGINALNVSAEEPGGKIQRSKFKVKVDTTPAEVGVETSPEMWKRKRPLPRAPRWCVGSGRGGCAPSWRR
jgi:hypothetical protein